MTAYKLAALAALALVSLTSCAAPEHATVEDCELWMVEAMETRGVDWEPILASGELTENCEAAQAKMTVEEFDVYLSDPTP